MKESDKNYFCQKMGTNPGTYYSESNALTTTPQNRRGRAKFDCNMPRFFDINQTGSPIIIPRPACAYLAAGNNVEKRKLSVTSGSGISWVHAQIPGVTF